MSNHGIPLNALRQRLFGPIWTRFAPAPTGPLHLGHVAAALYVWGLAEVLGAETAIRLEDHDRQRSRPEFADGILSDLAWLGFTGPVSRQSERAAVYEGALGALAGEVYPCWCSRKALRAASAANAAEIRYPGHCRERAEPGEGPGTLRLRVPERDVSFWDARHGDLTQCPAAQCGDLALRDRKGNWTYHFAAAVDDAAQGMNLIIRGDDILPSTGRQILLQRQIAPEYSAVYVHHPLILTPAGEKLAKRDGATGLATLRAAGKSPAEVLGLAAHSVGLLEREEAIERRDIARLFG